MNKLPLIARLLLGLIFFVFGLNGFLHFIPMPPMTGAAEQFFTGLIASVYFLPFMAGTQVVCGALLLLGMWVPLALVALAPVILNIIFYHAFVAPQGLGMAAFICVLEIYLAFFAAPYCGVVKQLFTNPKK